MPSQNDLFATPSAQNLELAYADVQLYRAWLPDGEASDLMQSLIRDLPWEQPEIIIAGQRKLIPRLQAWFGDPGANMRYSGRTFFANSWHPKLADLRDRLQKETGFKLNSVLVNLYRNGDDSVGWHADDETELGKRPEIASLSLGESREFHLKPKAKEVGAQHNGRMGSTKVLLENGDLLTMAGGTQEHWLHSVPKSTKSNGQRINLTFRRILKLA